ncbi:MAG: DNA mismatch repair endonuclease MutL [Tannerella sp.]|jgi:DNA mismatch repair protein MutL|nr:DNA mismatch repair endonuclease MutL [Tannerella sp.]
MSDIIHLLPDHIANQIAAGEVIQRPASVVKEMMENSIDAGAKNITVNIKDAGRTLIQIIDDGKGMSETDARMAFERHATSKISSVDDLFALSTMGFRGEALASIAAVAQVELRTRVKGGETGVCISISGSNLDYVEAAACNEGSIFSVKNLFFNVPARRKFLKTNETEFRHILTEFERVALAYPHLSFKLRHNDSDIFNLSECILKQRIIDIFGKGLNQKLLSLDVQTSLVSIRGYIGSLDSAKKTSSALQYFFVNGRYMRHPYFHRAVMQAYEKLLPAGTSPDYFLYFTIEPSTIDVNIHPTKTEIKFENEKPVWQILFSAVREVIAKSNAIPTIDFDLGAGTIDIPAYNPLGGNVSKPQLHLSGNYNPFEKSVSRGGGHPSDDWKALYEGFEKEAGSADSVSAVSSEADEEAEERVGEGVPIPAVDALSNDMGNDNSLFVSNLSTPCFQYKNRYIITPLKSGLVVIDQHRAHVRILYERFIGNIIRQSSVSQKLIFPEMIDLTAAEKAVLTSVQDDIHYLGFEIDFMGGNSYAINGVPADVTGVNPATLLKEIFADAIENGVSGKEKLTSRLALTLAKTAAIRAGKQLSPEEMEQHVASLFSLETNGITPDGLPILTIITDEEIEKRIK